MLRAILALPFAKLPEMTDEENPYLRSHLAAVPQCHFRANIRIVLDGPFSTLISIQMIGNIGKRRKVRAEGLS